MGSSKALRIGIDLDDVIADLIPAWVRRINIGESASFQPEDVTAWEFWDAFGMTKEKVFSYLTPDIYDSEVAPIEGAVQAVRDVQALGYNVCFVSSCFTPQAFNAKQDWLTSVGLQGYGLIPVGPWTNHKSKNDVDIDWLVDDHIGNLETFTRGYPVLVTRPHNRNLLWNGKRIKHLRDIIPLLKFETRPTDEPWAALVKGQREWDLLHKSDSGTFGVQARSNLAVRKFETGATRDIDTDKLDYEGFLSPIVLKRFAEYMHKHRHQSDGSLRASDNWQKGIPVDAYMKSLTRHFMDIWLAHRTGQPFPQEEACAMLFNVQGLLFEDLKAKTPVSSGSTD